MAEEVFRVVFTFSAWEDLEEIVAFWAERGEHGRGEQYAQDLPAAAVQRLSIADTARQGRHIRNSAYPDVRELSVFRRSYRILYRVNEAERIVEVLRFWHSHLDEPLRD